MTNFKNTIKIAKYFSDYGPLQYYDSGSTSVNTEIVCGSDLYTIFYRQYGMNCNDLRNELGWHRSTNQPGLRDVDDMHAIPISCATTRLSGLSTIMDVMHVRSCYINGKDLLLVGNPAAATIPFECSWLFTRLNGARLYVPGTFVYALSVMADYSLSKGLNHLDVSVTIENNNLIIITAKTDSSCAQYTSCFLPAPFFDYDQVYSTSIRDSSVTSHVAAGSLRVATARALNAAVESEKGMSEAIAPSTVVEVEFNSKLRVGSVPRDFSSDDAAKSGEFSVPRTYFNVDTISGYGGRVIRRWIDGRLLKAAASALDPKGHVTISTGLDADSSVTLSVADAQVVILPMLGMGE